MKVFKLRHVFNAWIDVINYQNLLARKTIDFQAKLTERLKNNAISKWRKRNCATKQIRLKIKDIKTKRDTRLKENILLQLKGDIDSKKLLCIKLSNLVHKYEIADKQTTFQHISSFA